MDPGRLGVLLQMEAVVGIGSAAVLTDEPFGLVELLGPFWSSGPVSSMFSAAAAQAMIRDRQ